MEFDHGGNYRDNRRPVLTMTRRMYGFYKYNAAKPQLFLYIQSFDFYFSTLISYQWMFGLSYFVDYLIKESPCCGLQPTVSGVSIPECLHNLRFVFQDHL